MLHCWYQGLWSKCYRWGQGGVGVGCDCSRGGREAFQRSILQSTWAEVVVCSTKHRLYECLQVATLYNLCKALQSFHSRGMVHCSLSPPDFSWYQGGQGWKVASCGDWAQQGMHVRSCYSLRYASPEVRTYISPFSGICADMLHIRSCYSLRYASPEVRAHISHVCCPALYTGICVDMLHVRSCHLLRFASSEVGRHLK